MRDTSLHKSRYIFFFYGIIAFHNKMSQVVEAQVESPSSVTPDAVEPEVSSAIKKNKKRKISAPQVDESQLVHYLLIECHCGDKLSHLVGDAESEGKKKKQKRHRVISEASARPINLWREVTASITGSKQIVTKKSPQYEECCKAYTEKLKELGGDSQVNASDSITVPAASQ